MTLRPEITDRQPKWRLLVLGLALVAGSAMAQVRGQILTAELENPWGLAFLPEGRFLVSEKTGRLRVVEPDGKVGAALQGLPAIASGGQGGLLDVLADSAVATNRTIYFCFSEPAAAGASGNSTALASARLSADRTRLETVRVLFSQKPKVASSAHFGCRIVEARDGTLFLTLGDRFSRKEDAQKLDNHLGKVVRIRKDGTVPPDNPFVRRAGALPEIWSYGHRNGQGATLAPDGRLWMTEHGPQGGDEINVPEAGRNYGWPVITYGVDYSGVKIGVGTEQAGLEQPLHYWDPSISPSGLDFYEGALIPGWDGDLLAGGLSGQLLVRLDVEGDAVVSEERLFEGQLGRVRDVRVGPDGAVYLLTDDDNGRLIRVAPEGV